MKKSAFHSALVITLVIMAACVRVQVEVPQSTTTKPTDTNHIPGGSREPPPEGNRDSRTKRAPMGTALQPDFIVPTQYSRTSETQCAADKNMTRAVAQETGVWCWAASAEGVMSFHDRELPQCETVTRVKAGDARDPNGSPLCCKDKWNGRCQRNGWTHEIFDKYHIAYKWWDMPFSQDAIRTEICRHGPFSYSIAYEEGGGHTFVIKRHIDEGEQMSLVVDSHEYFLDSQGNRIPEGFKKVSYWAYKEGWYGGTPNRVDYTYYSIDQATN